MLIVERKEGYSDKFRSYQIVLDGAVIGKIKQGELHRISLDVGKHSIQLKIDWCTSRLIFFEFSNQPVKFICSSKKAIQAGVSSIFNRKSYILLEMD